MESDKNIGINFSKKETEIYCSGNLTCTINWVSPEGLEFLFDDLFHYIVFVATFLCFLHRFITKAGQSEQEERDYLDLFYCGEAEFVYIFNNLAVDESIYFWSHYKEEPTYSNGDRLFADPCRKAEEEDYQFMLDYFEAMEEEYKTRQLKGKDFITNTSFVKYHVKDIVVMWLGFCDEYASELEEDLTWVRLPSVETISRNIRELKSHAQEQGWI